MKANLISVQGLIVLVIGVLLVARVGWLLFTRSDDPARILWKLVVSVVIMGMVVWSVNMGVYAAVFAAACGIVLAILWAPHLGALMATPFTGMFDGGNIEPELRPFYSIAEARRKFGRFEEAIAEITKQLEKFPQDFQGWMMLAEIYGENLKDLERAQSCINEILSHEAHTPKNISYALTRLGEWHLTLRQDRAQARAYFQEIIERYPDSECAHNAEQRIAHLATPEMLAQQTERPTITLTHYDQHIGLENKVADPRRPEEGPGEAATRLVKHLGENPLDYEAREELARIYAGHYQRLDLAADQLEQLINSPNQPQKNVARWLNMLADFHIALGSDSSGASEALQRVIDRYPKSAVAANAQTRLAYVDFEMKKREKSQVMKLGSYEEKIGLKGQVPGR